MTTVKVDYLKHFEKQFKKAPLEVKDAFLKRLELFKQDSLHPLLNNHPLAGKFISQRSINVTGDWRAIYREVIQEDETISLFIAIGTHSQLYK